MKYSHYFKSVEHLTHIDVYRVLDLFKVERASVAHAVKKLLCAGNRGAKNYVQDITEARDSLNRELEMIAEDEPANLLAPIPPAPPKPTGNDEIENFLRKQGVSEQSVPPSPANLIAPAITAFTVYPEVSQSKQMVALNGRVIKMIPHAKLVPLKHFDVFNYLFGSLKLYWEKGSTLAFLDEAFRQHFGITDKSFRVFEDFLEIVQHSKFEFDDFDYRGNLLPK